MVDTNTIEESKVLETIINITDLRDIEQRILNHMLSSKENFISLEKDLTVDDFTFTVHKFIFQEISFFCDKLNSLEEFKGGQNIVEDTKHILDFIVMLNIKYNIRLMSLIEILIAKHNSKIEEDLNNLYNYSIEKLVAIQKFRPNDAIIEISFETKFGTTVGYFKRNRLYEVETTNILNITDELFDTSAKTMEIIASIDLDYNNEMTFSAHDMEPLGTTSFYIKRNISEINAIDTLYKWANEYELDDKIFPRDKIELLNRTELYFINKNIKTIPKEISILENLIVLDLRENKIQLLPLELFKLNNLKFLMIDDNNINIIPQEIHNLKYLVWLSFSNNKIKVFPEGICSLKNLEHLFISNNKIEQLPEEIGSLVNLINFQLCSNMITNIPDSFYMITNITEFCFHNNEIKELSNKIVNFKKLKTLCISNNNISLLPDSISELTALKILAIENTKIKAIPIELLKLPKLEELCFDDRFLSFISKNIKLLSNINTLNILYSNFELTSKEIDYFVNKRKLGFTINKEKWMEDKDKLDNGCIRLSKFISKEDA